MALLTRKAIDVCLATAWVTCPDYSRTRPAMRACMLGTPLSSASPFSFKKLARFFCPFFFANKNWTGRKNNWHKRTSNSSSSWRDLQFPLIFEKNGSLLEKLCSNVSLQSLEFTMSAQCAALRCTEAHVLSDFIWRSGKFGTLNDVREPPLHISYAPSFKENDFKLFF